MHKAFGWIQRLIVGRAAGWAASRIMNCAKGACCAKPLCSVSSAPLVANFGLRFCSVLPPSPTWPAKGLSASPGLCALILGMRKTKG